MEYKKFSFKVSFEGSDIELDLISDSEIGTVSNDINEIAAYNTYIGAILSWQKKLLANTERTRRKFMAANKNSVLVNMRDRDDRVTEASIEAAYYSYEQYVTLVDSISELTYKIDVLSNTIWSIKYKMEVLKMLHGLE